MKGLKQTIYSTLAALCCVLSYTDGKPSPQTQKPSSSGAVAPPSLGFQPSRTQCCKLGEFFAKKKFACEFGQKFEVGKTNTSGWEQLRFVNAKLNNKITMEQIMVSSFVQKLMIKADQCADANLIGYTTKCCGYRQRNYDALKICRKYLDTTQRNECLKEVAHEYP